MKSFDQILLERGLNEGGRVQKYIDSEVIRLMSPYTPLQPGQEGGSLIRSATLLTDIGSGKVRQGGPTAPYAVKWYYTPANFSGAPMRGNKWFERSMNDGGRKSILQGAIREAGAKR